MDSSAHYSRGTMDFEITCDFKVFGTGMEQKHRPPPARSTRRRKARAINGEDMRFTDPLIDIGYQLFCYI